jgi:predicted deacetylase
LKRPVLVSLHDVTPAHEDRVRRAFHLLSQLGVHQYALLVVPQWHGGYELRRHPEFVALLRERAAAGAEVFLHGLRHDEQGVRRAWHHRVRAFGRTNAEGEFLALHPAEAGTRMDRGLDLLRQCELSPVGFVPPAWLPGRDWSRLLRERQLQFTEDSWAVFNVATGLRLRASAYCWSTARSWHEVAGPLLAAARLRVQATAPLMRVAIHPPDMDSPRIRESLRRTLETLLATRSAVSYRDVLSS